nr:RING-H2 finger protein ATL70-like [Tanacetum cinerariifolium]
MWWKEWEQIYGGRDESRGTYAGEPSYDTKETQRGSSYIYSLGVFSGFFLLIILFYISYICKRRVRFQSPPPTTISLATNTNDTNNNHHFIRLSRGLDDDVLVTFLTYVYSEVIVSSKEDVSINTNSSECAVCLSDYKPSDVVRLLQECGHLFHVKYSIIFSNSTMMFPQHGGYAPQHGSHGYPNYPNSGGAATAAAAYGAHHLAHTTVVYASYGHYGVTMAS